LDCRRHAVKARRSRAKENRDSLTYGIVPCSRLAGALPAKPGTLSWPGSLFRQFCNSCSETKNNSTNRSDFVLPTVDRHLRRVLFDLRKMELVSLILASASPRRKALLAAAGLQFDIVPSHIDESLSGGELAPEYAERMARSKALSVSGRMPGALVLGADTVVELNREILLKPVDSDDARRMLMRLSDQTHTVITAFAIAREGRLLESRPVAARVTFRRLSVAEIETYLKTGEPFDKAGAYGIQGAGADFIVSVDGARDTVMGLPVPEVLCALQRCGFENA
jgi:septum formation protein